MKNPEKIKRIATAEIQRYLSIKKAGKSRPFSSFNFD